jgi:hypothetical protein
MCNVTTCPAGAPFHDCSIRIRALTAGIQSSLKRTLSCSTESTVPANTSVAAEYAIATVYAWAQLHARPTPAPRQRRDKATA